MSQPTNDTENDGPTSDIAPKSDPQEGVKLSTNNTSPLTQQYYNQPINQQQYQQNQQIYQQQQQQSNFTRPVLRRTDSRNSFRPPGPQFQNQNPQQQPQQPQQPPPQPQQIRQPPPRPPLQSSGSYYAGVRPPLVNPGPRFPQPQQPQQQQQQQPQPVRYAPGYEPQDGNQFRRAVNSVTDAQIRQQRPIQPATRPPGVFQQKPLSTPSSNLSSPSGVQKSFTLDNTDVNTSHSASEEHLNGSKNFNNQINNKTVDLLSSTEKKYDDIRSSSSLGFADSEKDIDTAALNGKSSSREDIVERPESRTGFLSQNHSTHSSMHKIDEDDDDAVITPSRAPLRSGKSTPMSNSSDNVSQKSVELNRPVLNDSKIDLKKSPTPPQRNSTDNLFPKLDDPARRTPSPMYTEVELKKSTPEPNRTVEVSKPTSLNIQEKASRSPSPGVKQMVTSRNETPPVSTPEQEQRKFVPNQRSQDMSPYREAPNRDGGVRSSPRTENRSILSGRRTPSYRSKGDNDSGVDESTQGNDRSLNGEHSSPRKTPSKLSKLPSGKCRTPIKSLQSPKSPDPSNSSEKKKLPMNKIQVGSAPSPNIKTVKSKIGSMENTSYKPGGGKVKVENRKIDFSKVAPRIAAKNDTYSPGGGDKKSRTLSAGYRSVSVDYYNYDDDEIQQQKLQWNAKSKIGSLENATYKPGGGEKKIETIKVDFKEKAKPKVGSKDNLKHVPGGGDIKSVEEVPHDNIENRKLDIQAQSKIGSLDNVKHKPGGGDIKIFDDKDYLKQISGEHQIGLSGSQSSLRSQQSQPEPHEPISDENLNQER